MPRPLWKGSLSFGLVSMPVKIFKAVQIKTVNFHQLRTTDGCRLRLKKVCTNDGQEVAGQNVTKGFEIAPDRYVMVDSEELKALGPAADRAINIEQFIEPAQLDPLYFAETYYLVPDAGAAKTYSLLLAAMQASGKAAITHFVMRGKEYLAFLRSSEKLLHLSTLHYAESIVPRADLEEQLVFTHQPTERELAMAEQLIESLAAKFEPAKYHNVYYGRLMELIETKASGQVPFASPTTEQGTKVIDLTAALEASLAAVKKKAPTTKRRRTKLAQ